MIAFDLSTVSSLILSNLCRKERRISMLISGIKGFLLIINQLNSVFLPTGTNLVVQAIKAMIKDSCDEVRFLFVFAKDYFVLVN